MASIVLKNPVPRPLPIETLSRFAALSIADGYEHLLDSPLSGCLRPFAISHNERPVGSGTIPRIASRAERRHLGIQLRRVPARSLAGPHRRVVVSGRPRLA